MTGFYKKCNTGLKWITFSTAMSYFYTPWKGLNIFTNCDSLDYDARPQNSSRRYFRKSTKLSGGWGREDNFKNLR